MCTNKLKIFFHLVGLHDLEVKLSLEFNPRVEGLMVVGQGTILNCVGKGRGSECPITAVNPEKGTITCGCDPPLVYNRGMGMYLTLRSGSEPQLAPEVSSREVLADRRRGGKVDESFEGFFSKGGDGRR